MIVYPIRQLLIDLALDPPELIKGRAVLDYPRGCGDSGRSGPKRSEWVWKAANKAASVLYNQSSSRVTGASPLIN